MANQHEVTIRISAKNVTKREFNAARKQLNEVGKQAGLTNKSVGKLGKGVGRAAQDFARFNPAAARASSLLGGFGLSASAAVPIIGAAGLAGAVGLATKRIIDMGVELTTLRDKTQFSLGFLQEMKFVSEQTGVGLDQLTSSVGSMARRLGDSSTQASKWLDRIGLSINEIMLMSPEEQFLAISSAISEMENPSQQTAAAMAILGDSGRSILPLLRSDVQALRDDFDDLGGKIDEDVLEAGRKLADNLTDLTTASVGLAGDGVGPLVEALAELSGGFVSATKAIISFREEGEKAPRWLTDLADSIPTNPLDIFGDQIQKVTEFMRLLRFEVELLQAVNLEDEFANLPSPPSAPGGDRPDPFAGILGGLDPEKEKRIRKEQEKVLRDLEQRAAEHAQVLARLDDFRIKSLREVAQAQRDHADAISETLAAQEELAGAMQAFPTQPGLISDVPFNLGPGVGTPSDLGAEILGSAVPGIGDLEAGIARAEQETRDLEEAQREYNEQLQAAHAIASLIGGELGQIVGQSLSAASAIQTIGGAGGLGGLFQQGSEEAGGGIMGAIGGIASMAGPMGAIAGIGIQLGGMLIKSLGRGADDVMDEVTRDIGAGISEGLAEQILESGENAQLFLKEIFAEGDLGIDRMAEEVGDLFSMFERGEIDQPRLIEELQETLPILIENFDELGPAGQEQVQRIIAAAQAMGLEFEELSDLIEVRITDEVLEEMGLVGETSIQRIREAAAELGVEFEVLLGKIQDTFAPSTLEEFAEEFGLTAEEARKHLEDMGIDFQTNAERWASSIGLTVAEFDKLREAVSQSLGKDLSREEFLAWMEATGVSAEELAETLGIDITPGTESAGNEAERLADETERAAEWGKEFADEMERAASALGGMSFPPFPGGGDGGGFQHGTPNADFMNFGAGMSTTLHGTEAVIAESSVGNLARQIAAALDGRGGGGVTITGPIYGFDDFKDRVAQASASAQRSNRRGIRGASRGR